ncbi:MAG TPA: tetratricopeptide repeat protein [Pirellulales bacterium]|nr:tetratricopeptide repeat protein [Pirellulales bacterium]
MRDCPSPAPVGATEDRPKATIACGAALAGDLLLMAGLVATGFLLACYKLADTDIWWHLRAGEWILENHRVPNLDPFTFGSSDRVWIDLHWLFELIAAVAFRVAGMPGVTVVAAATVAAALFAALVGGQLRSMPVAAGCWMVPLVLLGYRLHPRPELFSLLFLAIFLTVLDRGQRRPHLVWLLPVIEILWVNTHAFFLLGPIVFVLFFIGQIGGRWFASVSGGGHSGSGQRLAPIVPKHYAAAFVAIMAACLLNPYGIKGTMLPLELFPKISDPANDYKTYIDELFSPLDYARRSQTFVAAHSVYYRSLYLLAVGLPLSFVLPALYRIVRRTASATRARQSTALAGRSADRGLVLALVAAVTGLLGGSVTVVGDTVAGAPAYLLYVLSAGVWLIAANDLRRISPRAALLAVVTALGQVSTTGCLHMAFAGSLAPGGQTTGLLLFIAACWAAAAMLALQSGQDLFRMLLAVAFTYLGFQAMRNLNVFALVAGIVLSRNLGDWLGEVIDEGRVAPEASPALWTGRGALAVLLAVWIAMIGTGQWNRWANGSREFGLGESPGTFPHDAARFAGGDGLPDRAIAFDLGLAALYVFHNGPAKKVYMDPRLEVPSLETFQNYVAIDDSLHGRSDMWRDALQRLDNPLVLLDHSGHTMGEALLLTEGDWRCIHFDSQAAVFASRHNDVSAGLYPTVDLAARHFQPHLESSPDTGDDAVLVETDALAHLGTYLCPSAAVTWSWRIPAQWLALDRLKNADREADRAADTWALRGRCYWNLVPSFATAPPRAGEAWQNGEGLRWAQATWCFQQALQLDPEQLTSLRPLYDTCRARRMPEAQLAAGRQLIALGAAGPQQCQEVEELGRRLTELERLSLDSVPPSEEAVRKLVSGGLSATAAEWVRRAGIPIGDWEWQLVDRLAAAWMNLGRPDQARAVWQSARAPSEAELNSRLADAWWVEGDWTRAEQAYRAALAADPQHADSLWGLAMLYAEQGMAAQTRTACTEALEHDLPEPRRDELREVLKMVSSREEQ